MYDRALTGWWAINKRMMLIMEWTVSMNGRWIEDGEREGGEQK